MGLASRLTAIRFTWRRRLEEVGESAPRRCNHRRSDRSLWVDCARCQGAQDLRNDECRTAVIDALSREWAVDEIVLSRDSDVLYSSDCAELLSRMAGLVRLCRKLSESSPVRSECGGCLQNPRMVLSDIGDRALAHPIDLDLELPLTRIRGDEGCRTCSDRLESCVEQVRKEYEAIRKTVTRMVFHVAEDG